MKKVEILNKDFRDCIIPSGLVITDPPYNQGYHYNEFNDKMSEEKYIELLSKIPPPLRDNTLSRGNYKFIAISTKDKMRASGMLGL